MRFWLTFLCFIFLLPICGYVQGDQLEAQDDVPVAVPLSADGYGETHPYTLEQIPNPKKEGQVYFVSNPDRILHSSTVEELNTLLNRIEINTKSEFAIVIVDDYVGENDFEFALDLFNTWGIGKKDANNGLLLFIAKNRHEYRFISGYGMEGIFPDIYLKRVGEKYLVPNFRNEDYDLGVMEASTLIAKILESPDSIRELERLMPEAIPFWNFKNPILRHSLLIVVLFLGLYCYVHIILKKIVPANSKQPRLFVPLFQGCGCMGLLMFFTVFLFVFLFNNFDKIYQVSNIPYFILVLVSLILAMKITEGRSLIKDAFSDAKEREGKYIQYLKYLFVVIIITPLAWVDLISINRSFIKNRGRFIPPDESGDWERIVRSIPSADKGFLNQGQRNEERIGSRRYEIWQHSRDRQLRLIPWEIKQKYKECPKCGFYTLEISATKTIRPATYSSSGEGIKFDMCHNCSYRLDKGKFTIPKKVRSSSSSGRGSSSGGGSSSRSSGSFGGGSSGGGGAGGRW